jgi:hypothetical protein
LEFSTEVARHRNASRLFLLGSALRQVLSPSSNIFFAAITDSMGAAPFCRIIELDGALAQRPCQPKNHRFPGNRLGFALFQNVDLNIMVSHEWFLEPKVVLGQPDRNRIRSPML